MAIPCRERGTIGGERVPYAITSMPYLRAIHPSLKQRYPNLTFCPLWLYSFLMAPSNSKLNSRQHRFVINLLSGMSQTDAYINAGYNCSSRDDATSNSSTLMSSKKVSKFVEDYKAKSLAKLEETTLSPVEKRQILANFARAQLSDLLDDNGQPVLNKKSPAMKALKEWYHRQRIDRDGNPVITKSMKLIDPIAAIMEDNKMMGHYAPSKHLVGHKVQFEVVFTREVKGEDDEE